MVVNTVALVLALGFDTFAVAVGLGLSGLSRRDRYRCSVSFALAEGVMPLVGFLIGKVVASAAGNAASYIAIALLFGIGIYTIWDGDDETVPAFTATSLSALALLAASVSLDELAVGFSLGLLHIPILLAAVLIAVQAFSLTLLGTAIGRTVGAQVSGRASSLSGIVLTLLALFLLAEKIAGS